MGNVYKIVITGPFNAGKTEFVRTISAIPIVSTEKHITDNLRAVKEETTVAMDYGHVRIGDDLLHLYGTPGQSRLDFMWDILSKEMDFFVVLVDSCDRESLMQGRQLLRLFRRKGNVPYLVAANKRDLDCALPMETIAKALGADEQLTLVPCTATDAASVQHVLEEARQILRQREE